VRIGAEIFTRSHVLRVVYEGRARQSPCRHGCDSADRTLFRSAGCAGTISCVLGHREGRTEAEVLKVAVCGMFSQGALSDLVNEGRHLR
jgi:hypothetical protein